MDWKSPTLIIGIDAATWDVINPLLDTEALPNISRLMKEGAWGRLKSFTNYLSPALWTSITTGKLPEKHGVMDFYTSTRRHIRTPTLYDLLCGESGKVGLFRWYATWPPLRNGGFTVPCSVARTPETYPAELQFLNDLLRPAGFRSYLNGGVQLLRHRARLATLLRCITHLAYKAVRKPEHLEWWYRRRLVETAIYADIFAHLLRKYRPDFAAILFSHTDDLGHRYWRYREPDLFGGIIPEEVRKYGQVIDQAYEEADAAIGIILKSVPQDTLVIVLSDHGQAAGPVQETPYRMSQDLLARIGFRDQVWIAYLAYSAFLRPRETRHGGRTLDELAQALQQVRIEQGGLPVFRVSTGEMNQLAVDVIVDESDDLNQVVLLPGGQKTRLGKIIFTDGRLSGTHSDWGILIMKGPGVRKGHRLADATILDVAPTVLALRNLPVAKDMDGHVIEDAFEAGFLELNPLRLIDSYGSNNENEELEFEEGELEALERQLRNLGYL